MNSTPRQPTPYRLHLKRSRRWKAGATLLVFAAALALTHVAEHLGAFTAISPHLDDLLLGWPMAIIVALAGAALMGAEPKR